MKFTIITLLVSSMLIAQELIAESWSETQIYHAGDIVEFEGKSYLASYWNKGMPPIDNKIAWDGWITIKNHRVFQWKPHKAYRSGSVVKFNEDNYIAKWWNKNSSPDQDKTPWVKLTLGVGEEADTNDRDNILGRDKDGNGIRDSYELFIEKKYKDPVVKSYLKTAAREYQKVLELHLNPDIAEALTTAQADVLMNDLVALIVCNRELRKTGRLPLNSPSSSEYYNTIERAIARHKGERIIHHKLKSDYMPSVDRSNPCGAISYGESLNSIFTRYAKNYIYPLFLRLYF